MFIPAHRGESVLPNLPFFHRLLRYAHRSPSPIAIRDLNADIEKTYHHLLSDVLSFRKVLYESMSDDARRDLEADKEVYIGLLAPGGYEYTVGFIAILAIGGAVVPMGKFFAPRGQSASIDRYSGHSTGGRGFLLPTESTMRGFGYQYNKSCDCTVSNRVSEVKQRGEHSLRASNCINFCSLCLSRRLCDHLIRLSPRHERSSASYFYVWNNWTSQGCRAASQLYRWERRSRCRAL